MILLIDPGPGTGMIGEVEMHEYARGDTLNEVAFPLINPVQFMNDGRHPTRWVRIAPWTDRIWVRPSSWVEAPAAMCMEYYAILKKLKAQASGVVLPGEGS